jgi:hypothetical protein
MKPEELDKRHDAFKQAAVDLFRDTAELNPTGLPFIIRVDDQHGQNLLYAKIEGTPEGLVYLDEDDVGTISPDEDHING